MTISKLIDNWNDLEEIEKRKSSETERNKRKRYNTSPKGKEASRRSMKKAECRYRHMMYGARKRNLKCSISFEQYKELISGNFCSYCTSPLPEMGSGLDRVNWKLGYTLENVVPCCSSCNDKKGSLERIGFSILRIKELLKELNGN